jgi:molybdopterin synthase catalytic subunit
MSLHYLLFQHFTGITRDNFEGRQVSMLSYEAYEPMALQELNRLCDGARQQFADVERIAICHRLGLLSEVMTMIKKKRKEKKRKRKA